MNTFNPGILILTGGYNQNSSGGQITGGATLGDLYTIYYNTQTQRYYFFDQDENAWFSSSDEDTVMDVTYYGSQLDVSDTSTWIIP